MVGIHGIGEIPEPANTRQVQGRSKSPDSAPASATDGDGVQISQEAVEASQAADLVARTMDRSGLRHERVEQAKQNIEQGTYRVQEVVLQVAARLAQFVE